MDASSSERSLGFLPPFQTLGEDIQRLASCTDKAYEIFQKAAETPVENLVMICPPVHFPTIINRLLKDHGILLKTIAQHLATIPAYLPHPVRQQVLVDCLQYKGPRELLCELLLHRVNVNLPTPVADLPDVLAPPTGTCLKCDQELTCEAKIPTVRLYRWNGEITRARKLTLVCKPCGYRYTYDKYGKAAERLRFYDTERPAFVVSPTVVIDRKIRSFLMFDIMLCGMHSSELPFGAFAGKWSERHNHPVSMRLRPDDIQGLFFWGTMENRAREDGKGVGNLTFPDNSDPDACLKAPWSSD